MNTGAIIMMIIGCGGLWGGFIAAIFIARRHKNNNA